MNFCPFHTYKNLFGAPNTGPHSYRFLDTAMFDYILTILLAMFITFISHVPLELTTIGVFIMGIILHILFGVNTYTTRFLGFTCNK
jgi:hypothetical protein